MPVTQQREPEGSEVSGKATMDTLKPSELEEECGISNEEANDVLTHLVREGWIHIKHVQFHEDE